MGRSLAQAFPSVAPESAQAFSHVYSVPSDFAEVYLNRVLNHVNDILSMFFKGDLCSGSRNIVVLVKTHVPRLYNLLN